MHYLTKVRCNAEGEGIVFGSINEVISAYQLGRVALHARIKVRLHDNSIIETTTGGVILFDALPAGSEFAWVIRLWAKVI